jgi:hypothetical protein
MTALLYIVLGIIVAYYLVPIITRFLLIYFFKRWSDKMKKNFFKDNGQNKYQEHKDGDTVIQYKRERTTNSDPGGEYVDFEDLNDNT